jgi:hypothetical protein
LDKGLAPRLWPEVGEDVVGCDVDDVGAVGGQSGGGQKPAAQGALGAAFAKAFEDKNKRG